MQQMYVEAYNGSSSAICFVLLDDTLLSAVMSGILLLTNVALYV